jgi:hypothetical protein
MSYNRKTEYLEKNHIIWRRDPVNDSPTDTFYWGDYYADGTFECYELFRTSNKINTFKSLKWHLLTLWYLNPNLDKESFLKLAKFISNKENGFVVINISDNALNNVVDEVLLQDLERPPKNKLRKIIFKDTCGLSTTEKLKIVGSIIGKTKSITEHDIYEAMLYMHDNTEKITIKKLAAYFKCSDRTIHRVMSSDLKKEKTILNKTL